MVNCLTSLPYSTDSVARMQGHNGERICDGDFIRSRSSGVSRRPKYQVEVWVLDKSVVILSVRG